MEIIDSSLGMMYGTLLSPLLIGMGFKAGLVIPLILKGGIEIAFPLALCIGSALGAVIGFWITYKMKSNKLRSSVGILVIVSGVWRIVKLLI